MEKACGKNKLKKRNRRGRIKMNRMEIETKVIEVVALQFGMEIGEIEPETNFLTDLNSDSLDAVELVMCIEDRFDLIIPDDEADKMITVKMVVDHVEKELKKREDDVEDKSS